MESILNGQNKLSYSGRFFSNDQNKAFSSSKRSGSVCGSQEKKKLIAEKLVVRFFIKKKILTKNKAKAADRSTDRVQGIPDLVFTESHEDRNI